MIRRPPTGALLPSVLAVMVIIGLAASAALFMTRGERTASESAALRAAVTSAADEAEVRARTALGPQAPRMAVGHSLAQAVPVSNSRVDATARLVRLGASTFALTIAARASDIGGRAARRTTSVILRLRAPRLEFPAALSLTDGGGSPPGIADGDDHRPPAWECDGDSSAVPDTLHPFTASIDSVELHALRDRAAIRLPPATLVGAPAPVVRDGECETDDSRNWGDPGRSTACASWLPIIHASGDLTVVGGAGQGVLLVDGDLDVSGDFSFAGAVIVAGDITFGPGGAVLTGGVRAGGVVDASGSPRTAPAIARSSCALGAALLAAGRLAPAGARAWSLER